MQAFVALPRFALFSRVLALSHLRRNQFVLLCLAQSYLFLLFLL